MPVILIGLLFIASPAFAGKKLDACKNAYIPSYEQKWEISRKHWDESCRKNPDPRNLIRTLQRRFISRCRKKYQELVDAKTVSKSGMDSYCAQGVRGRSRLERMAPRKAAPVKKESNTISGYRGLGPILEALRIARTNWSEDACVTMVELVNHLRPSQYGPREVVEYVFYSKRRWEGSYSVKYVDALPPDYRETTKQVYVHDVCLEKINVAFDYIFKKVHEHGLGLESDESLLFQIFARKRRSPVWTVHHERTMYINALDGTLFLNEEGEAVHSAYSQPQSLVKFCGRRWTKCP